jgi:hypothetical protein
VLVDCAEQRAAEPNRVAAPMNNSREQLENETSLHDTAAALRKERLPVGTSTLRPVDFAITTDGWCKWVFILSHWSVRPAR